MIHLAHQLLVALLAFLLLGDVGVCPEPPGHHAVAVPHGRGLGQEPAPFAIVAAQEEIVVPGLAGTDAGEIAVHHRSEEHTSELQSLMRISYAVFCLKKKKTANYKKNK